MKIFVRVKAGAKQEKLEVLDQNHFRIAVNALPIDGRANDAVIKVLAKHLALSPSCITLTSGHTSRDKVFDVFTH